MPSPGFYNENRNRAYPFETGTIAIHGASSTSIEALPKSAVADAGFVAGVASGFDPAVHSIYLQTVQRSGTSLIFTFYSTAPALHDRPLVFTFTTTSTEYDTIFVDNNDSAYGTSEPSDSLYSASAYICEPEPLWYGYMVLGKLTDLLVLLPGNGTLTRGTDYGGTVEPSLIQSLAGSFISSVNLVNNDRTRVTSPDVCLPVEWPYPIGEVYVSALCLQGDIRFTPGYNCAIRQDQINNAIVFSAIQGAGEGEPCSEVALFVDEVPPPGSMLFEGGPQCNEVIRSINGLGGTYSNIIGGTGVTVTPMPAEHTIVIDVDMNQMAVCYPGGAVSETSESIG